MDPRLPRSRERESAPARPETPGLAGESGELGAAGVRWRGARRPGSGTRAENRRDVDYSRGGVPLARPASTPPTRRCGPCWPSSARPASSPPGAFPPAGLRPRFGCAGAAGAGLSRALTPAARSPCSQGLHAPALQASETFLELGREPSGKAAAHSAATGARGFAHDGSDAEARPAATGGASRRRVVVEEEQTETEVTSVRHKQAEAALEHRTREMTGTAPAPGPRAAKKGDAAPAPRRKGPSVHDDAESGDAETKAPEEVPEKAAEAKPEADAPAAPRSRGRDGVEMAPARIEEEEEEEEVVGEAGATGAPADSCPCNSWLVQHHMDLDLASQPADDTEFDAFFVHGRSAGELDALVAELEHARARVRCKRNLVGDALAEKKEKEEEAEHGGSGDGDGSQSADEIRAQAREIRSATAALLARTAADSRAQKQASPLIAKRDAAAQAAAARYERQERDHEERSRLHERSVQAAVDEAMGEKKDAEGVVAKRREAAEEKAETAEKAAEKAVQRAEADLADAKRQAEGRVSRAREAYDVSHQTAQKSVGDAEEQMGEARDREAASREQIREEQERLDQLREELAEERQQAA